MSDIIQEGLDTHGYILYPGFAQDDDKEKCSPVTHVSTVYDGDRDLPTILEDIILEKNKLPEVYTIDLVIDPEDWEASDDIFVYRYTDTILNETMITEVQTDKINMQEIVNEKIRWLLTEDVVGNTVPIYIQKKPLVQLTLRLIIYTKYTKIDVNINSSNWSTGTVAKEFDLYNDTVTNSHIAMFRLDRTNIKLFMDNNYSITNTEKGIVSIFTDNPLSINGQLILIDTSIATSTDVNNNPIDNVETGNWIINSIIPYYYADGGCCILNNELHLIGGFGSFQSHYKYNGNWTKLPDIPFNATNCRSIVYDNNIHIFTDTTGSSNNHYIWNGSSYTGYSLPFTFYKGMYPIIYNNIIYMIGTNYIYSGSWTNIQQYITPNDQMYNISATIYDNKVHIITSDGKYYIFDGNSYQEMQYNIPTDKINYYTIVAYNNRIHMFNSYDHYILNGNTFEKNSTVPINTTFSNIIVFNNELLIIGGMYNDNNHIYKYEES